MVVSFPSPAAANASAALSLEAHKGRFLPSNVSLRHSRESGNPGENPIVVA